MIARYSRPEMKRLWDDRYRYQVWLRIELAVCEALAAEGAIPAKAWSELKKHGNELIRAGGVDPERVDAHERVTRHDVIAFTHAVAERIGSSSRYIHFGLTSSDVVDTALSVMIQEAGKILLADVDALLVVLKKHALKWKGLPSIGRSHGIFAEPTSFGLKFLGWFAEWERNRARLVAALESCRYGKLSGAVGVSPHWSPSFEQKILSKIGLEREPVSTQVIARDRHAELMSVIAILGSSMERIAVELRHLQRSEVGEVREGFGAGQKGSSAMPHKRNPISTENLTGCARLLRSYSQACLENVALWHERDISHSSVERIALPDATLLLDYALGRLTGVLENLEVDTDRIQENLNRAGQVVFSGHILLELVKKGVLREDAYAWVQECALQSLDQVSTKDGKGGKTFLQLLEQHRELRKYLSAVELKRLGSLAHQLRHVPAIYASVWGKKKSVAKKR